MNAKKRSNFSGAFLAEELGNGAWRLTRGAPDEIDVFLRGAESGAALAFGNQPIVDLGIEWQGETARLSFVCGDRLETVATTSAIVHEPLGRLYESLPLVSFDADARRFWRRVFRVVRIPGGRHLLKFLTRSSRR